MCYIGFSSTILKNQLKKENAIWIVFVSFLNNDNRFYFNLIYITLDVL